MSLAADRTTDHSDHSSQKGRDLRLTALTKEFASFTAVRSLDLEIPAGLVGVFGPNGAGKSALLESILFTLFGRSRTRNDEIRTTGVNADCVTELEFQHEPIGHRRDRRDASDHRLLLQVAHQADVVATAVDAGERDRAGGDVDSHRSPARLDGTRPEPDNRAPAAPTGQHSHQPRHPGAPEQ